MIYDDDTQMVICILPNLKETNASVKSAPHIKFLNQNEMPRWYQKDILKLVLAAFIKLEQIVKSSFVMFNKQLTGVILNPRFAQMKNPLFDSSNRSVHICANIAGIPFID